MHIKSKCMKRAEAERLINAPDSGHSRVELSGTDLSLSLTSTPLASGKIMSSPSLAFLVFVPARGTHLNAWRSDYSTATVHLTCHH